MQKYKALIVDFDGTLANNSGVISDAVRAKIKALQENYIFSIATGRQYMGNFKNIVQSLDLKYPLITRGGAMIIDPLTHKTLHAEYMQDEDVKNVIDYLQDKKLDFFVEDESKFYTDMNYSSIPLGAKIEFHPLSELVVHKIPKIVVHGEYEQALLDPLEIEIQKQFSGLHVTKFISPFNSKYGLDITSEKATKHLGVLHFAKLQNIQPSEMVGVGDAFNDYPLLTACGLKIAMANAPKELKDIADDICPTVNEDGLVYVMDKYFR